MLQFLDALASLDLLDAQASLDLKLSVSEWVIGNLPFSASASTGLSELFLTTSLTNVVKIPTLHSRNMSNSKKILFSN